MALIMSENKEEVKTKGKALGAPLKSLSFGCYTHAGSKKALYYLVISGNAPDGDKVAALQKLITAQGIGDVVDALTSGMSLAAGTKGRDLWSPAKAGSSRAERNLDS